ncbi:MAG: HAD-IB family hydrolase [Gammaproteobacteria bacterium]|nr:HAD-IB family hydrolase [Gammaproteobacteria bacterium]MDH3857962.1 HAD-IB family hydrolase [Gammaproteobacteria bacterium]
MTLAIFDLDHTLVNGDSDYLWGEYMVKTGIVNEQEYRARNEDFYRDYQRGTLDSDRYLEFALEPLTHYTIAELHAWREDYVDTWIKPIIAPGTPNLLDSHRSRSHELLIISATNLFITEPIAQILGVPTVLATEPEIIDNRYTGRFLGTPTYQEGKVTVLKEWLSDSNHDLDGSYFYSDSINDISLLELVDIPVAVNPDEDLKAIAQARNWKMIDLL